MNYDEKKFAASANKKTMGMWLAMLVVLSAAYAMEVVKGLKSPSYFLMMELIAWIPFILGLIAVKVQGWHSKLYHNICGFGYGFFYLYIMVTSPGTLAFTYILPVVSMFVIYKNRNFIIRCGVASVVVLIYSIARNYMNGMNTPTDISNYEIQFGMILFCYIGYIVAINHMTKHDEALVGSIQANLDRVITTVAQVKGASDKVVDGVTVVRELSEETGLSAKNIIPIGELYTTPALIDEVIHMYIATDLTQGEQHLDYDEFVNTLKMPLSKAVDMVKNGEIKDSKTQTIILKADKYFGNK